MLRLNRGHSINVPIPRKFGPQFVGPFKVLERVGRLAYFLELPTHWTIYDIISIAHLELTYAEPFIKLINRSDHHLPWYQKAMDTPCMRLND